MAIVTGPKGDALRLDDDGKWVPTKVVSSPTGQKLAWGGKEWEPVKPPVVEDMARSVAPGLGDIAAGTGFTNTVHDWMQRGMTRGANALLGTNMGDPTDPKLQAEASQKQLGTNVVPEDLGTRDVGGLARDINAAIPSTGYQPQTGMGELTRMGVSFLPGLYGAGMTGGSGTALQRAGNVAGRVATRVAAPAMGATALGAGFNPVTEPGLHAAATVAGAILGHGVSAGGGRVANALRADPNPQLTAERYLLDKARTENVTPETINAGTIPGRGQLGGEAWGQGGVDLTATLGRRSGTTPQQLVDALTLRTTTAPNRLLNDMSTAAGIHPSMAQGSIDAMGRAGRDRAAPVYTRALSLPGGVMNPELEALSRRPVIRDALAMAAEDIRNEGGDPNAIGLHFDEQGNVTQVSHPTAAAWDKVKKAVGDQIKRNDFGRRLPDSEHRGNRNVNIANRDLSTALRRAIPHYGEAMDISGDYLSLEDAFERGQNQILDLRTTGAQVAEHMADQPQAYRDAYNAGITNKLFMDAQNSRLSTRLLNTPAVREKLTASMGADAANAFMGHLRDEIELGRTGARIYPRGGSISSNILLEGQQQDHAATISAALNAGHGALQLAHGNPSGVLGVIQGARHWVPDFMMSGGMNADVRNRLGALMQLPPDQLAAELRRLQQPQTNAANRATARALQQP